MNLIIKKAELEDKEGLLELFKKTADYHNSLDKDFYKNGEEQAESGVEYLNDCFNNKNCLILVSKDSKKVVGMLISMLKDSGRNTKSERIGFVSKAFVLDEYRGQGLMKRMFEEMKSWASHKEIKRLELVVNSKNELGLQTWQSFGFEEKRKIMNLNI
jgi:ribosomal protein S18 acetylase RimI-like enzyme